MIIWNQNLEKKVKLCSIDPDSFIVYIKIEDIYVVIEKMLKWDFILQIKNYKDHYLKEHWKSKLIK